MIGFIECGDEALNLIVIVLRHIRMNQNRLFGRAIQRAFKFQFFCLEAVNLVADQHGIDAILDGVD
jgi:hypothetical protein